MTCSRRRVRSSDAAPVLVRDGRTRPHQSSWRHLLYGEVRRVGAPVIQAESQHVALASHRFDGLPIVDELACGGVISKPGCTTRARIDRQGVLQGAKSLAGGLLEPDGGHRTQISDVPTVPVRKLPLHRDAVVTAVRLVGLVVDGRGPFTLQVMKPEAALVVVSAIAVLVERRRRRRVADAASAPLQGWSLSSRRRRGTAAYEMAGQREDGALGAANPVLFRARRADDRLCRRRSGAAAGVPRLVG